MIKPLLAYQEKEKEKLQLIAGVEGGRFKRELDEASRTIENSKRALLALENDAKVLAGVYESVNKNLNEVFDKIKAMEAANNNPSGEDEATQALAFMSALLSKVGSYENQLMDIHSKINTKVAAFEEAKAQVVKAQKGVSVYQAEYEKQKKAIEQAVAKINSELEVLAKAVDKNLLEKYKQIRKSDKQQRAVDVAVALTNNRCGGCHFELPLSLIHSVSANGYIICEECGKIIYK